tara:strand:+ start:412 stop:744 length:333 start_codon:yes stop_codon:yes gene_type:complete
MIHIQNNDLSCLKDKECYLLFYFTASWCGPCQSIKSFIEELSGKLDQSKIEICKIDFDQNKALAKNAGVRSIPTFILFKNKKRISSYSGANKEKISELIKSISENEPNSI